MYKRITIVLFSVLVVCISTLTIFSDATISYLERRYLATIDKVDLLNPDFYSDLDDYLSDHIAFRDQLIMLTSLTNKYVFSFKDNNGVYSYGGYLFDLLELNEQSIKDIAEYSEELAKTYFSNQEVYFMPIPRKSDYITRYRKDDLRYSDVLTILEANLDMAIIRIDDMLDLTSYYHTDIHWRMDKLGDIASHVVMTMGDVYTEVEGDIATIGPFYGSLYASSFYDVKADDIYYIDADFSDISVYDLEKNSEVDVYDFTALDHPDGYDFYLDGPSAYIEINNPGAVTDQELIVFRDSFGSSFIPLLIESYAKIQVIDLRYMSEDLLSTLGLSEDAKVLFMYVLEVINQSTAIVH